MQPGSGRSELSAVTGSPRIQTGQGRMRTRRRRVWAHILCTSYEARLHREPIWHSITMSSYTDTEGSDAMERMFEALAADREEVLRIGSGLDAQAWEAPSGCTGWSVKDVVAHMGSLFWAAIDPSVLPDVEGLGTEQAAEVWVAS